MNFGQLIEYNIINIFIPFLFFEKALYEVAWFQYISIARNLAYNRNKTYKTLNY